MKDIFKIDEGTSMIKLSAKKGLRSLAKIIFKNLSRFDLDFEVALLGSEDAYQRPYNIFH